MFFFQFNEVRALINDQLGQFPRKEGDQLPMLNLWLYIGCSFPDFIQNIA